MFPVRYEKERAVRGVIRGLVGKARFFIPVVNWWGNHFTWKNNRVVGITPSGHGTVDLLKMNRLLAVEIRKEERMDARHPPAD